MVGKTFKCPRCKKNITFSGTLGERKQVFCPYCQAKGFIRFKKEISKKENAIEVYNLKKIYGDLTAVDNISFSVKKGEIFAFLGPNGAGKTTTVEMIEAIRKPTNGNIKLLGRDIKTSFDLVKEDIGVLPQEFHSFELFTIKETLNYFSKLYNKRADISEIIRSMDLKSHENQLYRNLSGGLKQRVGVAIALVNDPEVVFLDEPTTGLDPKARRDVWNVIANLRDKGKTVFLTTHYMEEAEFLADRIAIIVKGKIIAEGTLEQLINLYGRGVILRIKECTSSDGYNILKDRGYVVKKTNNGDIEIQIDNKDRVLEILSLLRHECIEYVSIDIRRSNLEEVFLRLTGSKLMEAE